MKITKKNRPQDSIQVGLVQPSKLTGNGWIKPLDYEVTNPPTTMVRMPHGPFAVRVITTADTVVAVHIDGKPMLATRVGPGIHVLERDSWGSPFVFAQEECPDELAGTDAGEVFADADQDDKQLAEKPPEWLFLDDELRAVLSGMDDDPRPVARTHGLVMITVCFASPENTDAVLSSGPPDYPVRAFLQMNEPQAHARELAANLQRLVAPPPPRDVHELCTLHTDAAVELQSNAGADSPQKRFCAVCRRYH